MSDDSVGVLGLVDMDVGSKLGGAAGDEVGIVAPLGLLQDVLQK